jgi:hypothetical protein
MHMFRAILMLTVLALMPLGMQPAAAMAATERHPAAMAGHCQDEGQFDTSARFAQCTMACAAALPAVEARNSEPPSVAGLPLQALTMKALVGVLLEIDTPPPRLS